MTYSPGEQKKIDEALCEAVFLEKDENGDNAFTHIQLGDLERGYAALGGKLSANKFREKVKRWLKKHAPHIDQKRIDYQTPGRRLARQVYCNTCVADFKSKGSNAEKYLEKYAYKDLWCGPLV